jgi:hypothetical protein
MARTKKRSVRSGSAPSTQDLQGRIVKRPDGYYWEAKPGELRGPFDTREEAEVERVSGAVPDSDGDFGAGESLQEAESELGLSEWIDPETGDPAEDNIPRLEDH